MATAQEVAILKKICKKPQHKKRKEKKKEDSRNQFVAEESLMMTELEHWLIPYQRY